MRIVMSIRVSDPQEVASVKYNVSEAHGKSEMLCAPTV